MKFYEIDWEFQENFAKIIDFIFVNFRKIQNNFVEISCFAKFLKCCLAASYLTVFVEAMEDGADMEDMEEEELAEWRTIFNLFDVDGDESITGEVILYSCSTVFGGVVVSRRCGCL